LQQIKTKNNIDMKKTAALLLALLPLASMAQQELIPSLISELDLSKEAETTFNSMMHEGTMRFAGYFTDGFWDCWTEKSEEEWGKHEILISASSYLATQGQNKYQPNLAFDGDMRTAWVEGAAGDGIGETLEFLIFPTNKTIRQFNIYNGYIKSPSAYYNNARPKTLRLYINDIAKYDLKLVDKICMQTFYMLEEIKVEAMIEVKFEIMEVYPGKKWQDCAITDIVFESEEEDQE